MSWLHRFPRCRPGAGVAAGLVLALTAIAALTAPASAEDLQSRLAERAAACTWAPLDRGAPVLRITITGDPGGDWHLVPGAGGDVDLQPGKAANPGFTAELD